MEALSMRPASSDAKAYAHLARSEFYNQRMHRTPVKPYVPAVVQGPFDTCHGQSYRPRPPQKVTAPEFTVGRKNTIGTKNVHSKVSLDEFRQHQVSLSVPDSRAQGSRWVTTTARASVRPDLNDRFQGSAAVPSGIAPREPYSEVERRFAAVDSMGTMPGHDSLSSPAPPHVHRTEQQRRFVDPGPQPRREPESITLRYLNEIGSRTTPTVVPASQLNATHYELGTNTEGRFVTSSGAAHGRKPLVACAAAAGVPPPQGPSELERSFFTTSNSRDHNIVSNGERLSGPRNEAARHARSSCGRKQHPVVDPALRGPTGMRQARPARISYYRYATDTCT